MLKAEPLRSCPPNENCVFFLLKRQSASEELSICFLTVDVETRMSEWVVRGCWELLVVEVLSLGGFVDLLSCCWRFVAGLLRGC